MSTIQIIGLTATILGILGVVIGAAVRLAAFPAERKISSLENENEKLHDQLARIEENQAQLLESLRVVKIASSESQKLKEEIDQNLKILAQRMNVSSASILVPYPLVKNNKLVFLSILGPEAKKLKHNLIPINSSIAGEVYTTGYSTIMAGPDKNEKWNPATDKKIAFQTNNLLCVPISLDDEIIGVVQLLNRDPEFNNEDKLTVEKAVTGTLAYKVHQFTQQIDNFEILGLGYSQDVEDGTVIFCDLSSSSSLLKGAHPLPKEDVISTINEYLEVMTTTAIGNGCIVDKFMWDGCIFSLNILKSVKDHQYKAYQTALAMMNEFENLKSSWLRIKIPAKQLYNRVAITSGSIFQVDMGPAQYRQKTIVGDPVVAASVLCANAPRGKNTIVIDQSVYQAINSELIQATKIQSDSLGKAKGLITSAYQIELAVRSNTVQKLPAE
jgi:class 3 adenylate cyclase